MQNMDILLQELNIPEKYLIITDDKICATVHKKWLSGFTNLNLIPFVTHDQFSFDEIYAQPTLEELGENWTRIYIKVYKKKYKNVCNLPREKYSITSSKTETDLTFAQILQYVAKTNYQNLWKDYYKRYYAPWTTSDHKEQINALGSTNDVDLMKEIITRMYGCSIFRLKKDNVILLKPSVMNRTHCNLLPAILAIESDTGFFIFYESTTKYTLRDCVTYSPAAISMSYAKPLFLIYQLLRLSRDLHDCGLLLGEVTLSDILIMNNFNVQVLPNLEDNLLFLPDSSKIEKNKIGKKESLKDDKNFNISKLCEMWIHGRLSNFDYLTALNNLAGRKYGDPSCHHVMPWVTDFTSRCGNNWRDLTKSKFRLNKGDRQLDLTFDADSSQIGYHVSDVLSEITYYVYLSRRYSRSILCKHVRPLWVPGEYPASIQRLYDWSPDECIPQFFIDPYVFKSIHEDLPDLEIPTWATSPEDFIEKHREALESSYVSERLHHWIDLTFGYKLSGSAAVKSKNVCLHLVDNHTNLSNSGVVQLFTTPHPQKIIQSPYFSKIPPRLRNVSVNEPNLPGNESVKKIIINDETRSSDDEEAHATASSNATRSSPLTLSRLLSRSRSSLPQAEDNVKHEKPTEPLIILPKDYNPIAAILQVEMNHAFMNKISHEVYKPKRTSPENTLNTKQILKAAKFKEQQILGCLMVEIFLPEKFRAIWKVEKISFSQRLNSSIKIIKTSPGILPKCVQTAVMLLLQVDTIPKSYNIGSEEIPAGTSANFTNKSDENLDRYPIITHLGLPPPSAHQILQPVFSNLLFPSSKCLQYLYGVVEMIQEYDDLCKELDKATQNMEETENLKKTKIIYLCKIHECKVHALANELEKLLPDAGIATGTTLQLIVPHVKEIFEKPLSAVLAAWYLFDPISRALGPRETAKVFLTPLVNLYDKGSLIDKLPFANSLPDNLTTKFKTVRLYHRSFLLKLIVRLGLKCFLENFITPLVEAVGGYKNHLAGLLNPNLEKTGLLKDCDIVTGVKDGDPILSPLDEDSSIESENVLKIDKIKKDLVTKKEETFESTEGVFVMEAEEAFAPSPNTEVSKNFNFEPNLEIEDFSSEIKLTTSDKVKSPVIPIPKTLEGTSGKSVPELNSICCKVGSTNANDDLPLSSSYSDFIHALSRKTRQEASSSAEPEQSFVYVQKEEENILDKKNVRIEEGSKNQRQSTYTECSASEISAESVIWLSHRLGPVLTSRYLSRNLLRMLTLCYFAKENLTPTDEYEEKSDDFDSNKLKLVGDANALKVLECLSSIVGLFGEHTIVLQYFSHMTELVAQCKRKLTPSLEGGLVSCLVLLIHVTPHLSDSSLMDIIQEVIVKSVLLPTVRILSTTKFSFPNGSMARFVLANKYLEVLFILINRLGNVMAKNHLILPLKRFFMIFEKAFNAEKNEEEAGNSKSSINFSSKSDIEPCQDDSFSPITDDVGLDIKKFKAYDELKEVFSASLAHKAYVSCYRLLNDEIMDELINNHPLIRDLFHEFEQGLLFPASSSISSENKKFMECNSKSFGKISTIGNKIKLQPESVTIRSQGLESEASTSKESSPFSSASRQLRGNWLAYWEHEIGRPDKEVKFNIKQIKLQAFSGHTNSVRCLYVLDNENSFMSGSRDRTVKLWSLRSQGDGSVVSPCQFTYSGHKKSIISSTFLESLRYAVTCDGSIHCWDPFMGSFLGSPESTRPAIVNALTTTPAPSTTILVATTDIMLRVIDCRTFQYVNELKISMNPTGLIRSITVAPSGHWVAVGQASGIITILDIRTGLIIASWKGHESEILQLQAVNETTIVSSSLDQTVSVWSAIDGKLKFHLKGVTEPVHCLTVYEQQLISGTTANRVGVHSALDDSASCTFSKLRSDTFKGVLSTMALLPLNRLLLLGADNGNINLIC